jgi:hypothetical protein
MSTDMAAASAPNPVPETVRSVPPANEPICGWMEVMRGGISASKESPAAEQSTLQLLLVASGEASRDAATGPHRRRHRAHTCRNIDQLGGEKAEVRVSSVLLVGDGGQADVEKSARKTTSEPVEHAPEASRVGEGGGEERVLSTATDAIAAGIGPRVAAKRLRAHVGGLAILLAARAQHRHSATKESGRKPLRPPQSTIDAFAGEAKRSGRLDCLREDSEHARRAADVEPHLTVGTHLAFVPALCRSATNYNHDWQRYELSTGMVVGQRRRCILTRDDAVHAILGACEGLHVASNFALLSYEDRRRCERRTNVDS